MFWKGLFSVLQFVLQGILNICASVCQFVMSVFPRSPFSLVDSSQYSDFLAQINYFVPFYELISIMEVWLIAIAAYYLYSVIARWVKAIE